MQVVREELNGGLLFYTNDELIQETVLNAVMHLDSLGVVLAPNVRPLQIFHREPLEGGGGDDPFWSHYSPVFHSIQIIDSVQSDKDKRETIWHEIGHALLGHTLVNHYAGGSHSLLDPAENYALAMSEGWANFVGVVLATKATGASAASNFKGADWENLSITPNGKVEYCVGAFLWDLYDKIRIKYGEQKQRKPGDGHSAIIGNNDRNQLMYDMPVFEFDEWATVSFSDLFSVYSPSLAAILDGPWVSSVWDYADRLEAQLEGQLEDTSFIQEILLMNCGPRPDDANVWDQLKVMNKGILAEVS